MCLRSKLLHPPVVLPLVSPLIPSYFFSVFSVPPAVNSNRSLFRVDTCLLSIPEARLPNNGQNHDTLLALLSCSLKQTTVEDQGLLFRQLFNCWEGKVNPALNLHHLNGHLPSSHAWHHWIQLGLPSLLSQNDWDDLAWWTVGINALLMYLRPGEGCGVVLVGSPVVCWLVSYWPVGKLPSVTSLSFAGRMVDSLLGFPPVLYVCPLMQGPHINGCLFNLLLANLNFSPQAYVIDWMTPFPKFGWGLRTFLNSSEGNHQMIRFILRIESYSLSLHLAQTLIFISSQGLVIDIFSPLLSMLFSAFCSSTIIGVDSDDDDTQCLSSSSSVPEYTGLYALSHSIFIMTLRNTYLCFRDRKMRAQRG